MSLSTHVLDLAAGRPAEGVVVLLETLTAACWTPVAQAVTNIDGRCSDLLPDSPGVNREGIYRLHFETGLYFTKHEASSLYPYIEIVFSISGDGHYHIPLLLAANGYTTYRGS